MSQFVNTSPQRGPVIFLQISFAVVLFRACWPKRSQSVLNALARLAGTPNYLPGLVAPFLHYPW